MGHILNYENEKRKRNNQFRNSVFLVVISEEKRTWAHCLQGVMADPQCAAEMPLSGSSEHQEQLRVFSNTFSLTKLLIAELNS